jgi:hypothetical protein
MSTLAITVHGPFAYVDNYQKDDVLLMAPMCPQHNGAMFSIGADTPLPGNRGKSTPPAAHIYRPAIGFSGPKRKATEQLPAWYGEGQCLRGPQIKDLKAEDWRFWIVLPRPDSCARLNPVPVSVNGGSDLVTLAVGVRFLYTSWDGNPVVLPGVGMDPTFTFPEVELTQYGDLQVELSGPVRDDPDHEDAMDCFSYLSGTLGYEWSVEFPVASIHAAHGNDCHAPVIWVVPLEQTPSQNADFIDYDHRGRKRAE